MTKSQSNPKILIYTKVGCPYCVRAVGYLKEHGHLYQEIDVTQNPEKRKQLAQENRGYSTVPMIFIEGKFIGGCSELLANGVSNGVE